MGRQGIVSLSYAGAINVSNTDGVTDAPFVNVGRDVGSTGQINVERFGAELNITQNGTAAAGGAFLGIGRDGAATVSVSGGGLSVTGDNALITVAHELNAGDNTRSGQLEIYQGEVSRLTVAAAMAVALLLANQPTRARQLPLTAIFLGCR